MQHPFLYVKCDVSSFDVGRSTKTPRMTLEKRLGDRCRKLRHRAGLSQLDMVRDHGFSLSHYQKIERGTLDARLSTLSKIAAAFGVNLSELLRGL
jgi:DNA-binding XRE family transcriptional regulator